MDLNSFQQLIMTRDFLRSLKTFLFHPVQVWPYPRVLLDTIVAGIVVSISMVITFRLFGADEQTISGENGVLETIQTIELVGATVLAMLAAVRLRPAGRFVAITTALICMVFLVREIPSCRPDVALACVPRAAHRITPSVGGALLLLQALMMCRTSPVAFLRMIHPFFSWPLAFIAGLLVSGEIFEKMHYQSLEEIAELVAYMGLLLSSAWMLMSSFQTTAWQGFSQMAGALVRHLQTSARRHR